VWQITLKARLRHAAIGILRVNELVIKELADGQIRAEQVPGELRAGLASLRLLVVPNLELAAWVALVKAE
jgi:hypothetical protein